MNDIAKTSDYESPRTGAFDRFLRQQLLGQLSQLRHGRLLLTDDGEQLEFGDAAADLQIHMEILDSAFYRAIATHGSVGAGEAYMDGLWRCDNLVGLVQLLVSNRDMLDGMESGLARLGGMAMRGWHALRRNTRDGSRRNIAAHYDLGNDFFPVPVTGPDVLVGDLDGSLRHARDRLDAQARTHLPQTRSQTD